MASLHSQPQKRPAIKRIMTWSKNTKKHAHLFGYENAADDESQQPVPPSPTPSHKSVTKTRPSLFHTFARRNSTKSESSRSRSPTSPRLSTEGPVDRTPSPTPSRNSMIFERDIEYHDSLSVHEAIDLGIPPVLDEFVSSDIPSIVENGGDEALGEASDNPWVGSLAEGAGPKPPLSLNIIDNRPPSPEPYEHPPAIADTLRVTTPKELKVLAGNMFENPWK